MRLPAALLLAATLTACGTSLRPMPHAAGGAVGAFARGGSFTAGTLGGRGYKLFAPGKGTSARPLMVMLHGCVQDPDDFARGTQMNAIAEKEGFFVLYPAQTRADQMMACMPWFEPNHWGRGQGLSGQIAAIIEKIGEENAIDRNRVYVAGLSAGGAYASALVTAYPDVFAAMGVHSGLEYGAATSQMAGQMAMSMGGPDPIRAGNEAYKAMGSRARVIPTIVFHGTSDYTVQSKNGDQVARQWAQTNDLASDGKDNDDIPSTPTAKKAEQSPNGRSFTRYSYADQKGQTVVEQIMVDGMAHAWSGGDKSGSYTDPKGPDASAMMWDFFKARTLNGKALKAKK